MCIYILSLKCLWCDTYKSENRDQATSSSRKWNSDMLLRDMYQSRADPEIYAGVCVCVCVGGSKPNWQKF